MHSHTKLSCLLLIACTWAAVAQPLAIEDMAKLKAIRAVLKFSPDGRFVAYEVQDWSSPNKVYFQPTRFGTPPIGVGSSVWIVDTESQQARNLTPDPGNHWGPSWSPDGKYLAYYSDRNHKPQLWLWDVAKGSARLATQAMVRPASAMDTARWTPDDTKILLKLVPEGMSLDELARLNRVPEEPSDPAVAKSEMPTIKVYSSTGSESRDAAAIRAEQMATVTNSYVSDLALVDVSNGQVERIAKGVKPTWYEFSPKGDQIAFVEAEGGETHRIAYDLAVISLPDGKPRVLARGFRNRANLFHTITWSPDGTSLAYTDAPEGAKWNCYVVPVSGGQPRLLASGSPPGLYPDSFRGPLWSADGRTLHLLSGNAIWTVDLASGVAREAGGIPGKDLKDIVATANESQVWSPDRSSIVVLTLDNSTRDAGFYRFDTATGASRKLIEQAKIFRTPGKLFLNVSRDGKRVAYIAEDTAHPADAWIADWEFREPRKLTNINPQLSNVSMGSARLIEWKTVDGQVLKGALMLPANYQAGKRYPLIVKVYGGEMMSNRLNQYGMGGNVWADNNQFLATRGYAVLLPDMPLKVGTPMRDIARTVLPGIDKVIETGIADPKGVGVMGGSYGGYSVLCLIVQSPIFRAAIMHAGQGDLFAGYGEMNEDGLAATASMAETGQFRMGGTPWEYRNRYIENSPFFYLDRVETPLLITHGTSDDRVPAFLGEQIFVGLRRLGKEVTYVKYRGEGHLFAKYANQVDWLNRAIAWFDDHLKHNER